MNKEQFIEAVEKMSVAELNDLVKALEEKFGVSAAALAGSTGSLQGASSEDAKYFLSAPVSDILISK